MLRLCALSSTTVCNGMKEVPREVKGWMRRGNEKRWRTNDCWQHEKTSENFQFSTFQLSQVIRSTHSYLLPLLFVSFHFGEFPTFNTQMLVVNVTHRIEYIIIFPNHNLEYSCSWLSTSFALFGITDHVKRLRCFVRYTFSIYNMEAEWVHLFLFSMRKKLISTKDVNNFAMN